MFKKYLRVQPSAIQLLIFLSFWSILQLLFYAALPVAIKTFTGLQVGSFSDFFNNQIHKYPQVMVWINAWGAVFTFLAPALIFAYLAAPKAFNYLGFTTPRRKSQVVWVILLALALVPVVSILGGWIKELNLGEAADEMEERREQMMTLYLQSGNALDLVRNVIFIALVPAICEEVFFRGVIQRFAHTWLKKAWLSIGVSGVLFALFHASVYQVLPIMIAGFVLAWVYHITSSLWLNILLHFIFNGLQVVLAYYAVSSPQLEAIDKQTGAIIGFFAGGLLIAAVAVFQLRRERTPLPDDWSVVYPDIEEPVI